MSAIEMSKSRQSLRAMKVEKKTGLYKILCDETKFKILFMLSQHTTLSVCDIAKIINTSVSAVSHQLNKLKLSNLIVCEKSGRLVLYRLKDRKIVEYL